jgi:hypothetical protein
MPLMNQAADMAVAVPQVFAHRMTRLALAGAAPSPRDRKEFELMGAEKAAAFAESWRAMVTQAMRAQQELTLSMMRSAWAMPLRGLPSAGDVATQLNNAAMGVLSKGMAPVHRRAVANAKRLGRTPMR